MLIILPHDSIPLRWYDLLQPRDLFDEQRSLFEMSLDLRLVGAAQMFKLTAQAMHFLFEQTALVDDVCLK
jgi:hypothetical protein